MHRSILRFIEEPGEDNGGSDGDASETFTQEDVNKIIGQTRQEERKKAAQKYADYDALKAQASQSKTLEQRLAEIEDRATRAELAALRSDIAAEHSIGKEDRDLFLTGTDKETLTAQAKRLAQRETDRKKRGNVAPKEGGSADTNAGRQDSLREFTRNLFGNADD